MLSWDPVKAAHRHGIAAGASVVVHSSVVVWGLLASLYPAIEMPEIEFELTEVELLDPDAIQGDDGPGEFEPPPIPAPPPPPEPKAETPPEPGPEPAPPPKPKAPPKPDEASDAQASDAEPRRSLGRKNSRVDHLGPASSTFHFFLVPSKIRKMEHAEAAMDIMASFPDFEYLVDEGGFDPLHDFDHLVISTPNITDPRQTFLVVDYQMDRDDVRRTIERAAANRGEIIEWIDEGGILRANPRPADPAQADWDPRWFVLPQDLKIAAYIREEFVPALLKEEVGEEKTASNYVANLAKLRQFAARIPSAGFQFLQRDIHVALKRVRGLEFPVPDSIEVTMEAAADPELMLRATFLDELDARQTELWLTERLAQIIEGNLLLRLQAKWLYELIEVERNGKELTLWGRLDAGQTKLLLKLAADQVAKVQRKDPEEIEASRLRREENWKKRNGGKLPPSALDEPDPDEADGKSARPADGETPKAGHAETTGPRPGDANRAPPGEPSAPSPGSRSPSRPIPPARPGPR